MWLAKLFRRRLQSSILKSHFIYISSWKCSLCVSIKYAYCMSVKSVKGFCLNAWGWTIATRLIWVVLRLLCVYIKGTETFCGAPSTTPRAAPAGHPQPSSPSLGSLDRQRQSPKWNGLQDLSDKRLKQNTDWDSNRIWWTLMKGTFDAGAFGVRVCTHKLINTKHLKKLALGVLF